MTSANPTTPQPLLLRPRDAAKMLAVCERTIWSLAKRGELRPFATKFLRAPALDVVNRVLADADSFRQHLHRHAALGSTPSDYFAQTAHAKIKFVTRSYVNNIYDIHTKIP